MRLLVAGAMTLGVAWTPGVAMASPPRAVSRPLSPDLRALGVWAQQVIAAQQPALDIYRRCQPITQRAAALLGDAEAIRPLLPEMTACLADFEAAVHVSASKLAALGPMPASYERLLGIDSAAILRQSAATLQTLAGALNDNRNGLEKAASGDAEGARTFFRKGKAGAVATIDAQIQILHLFAKSSTVPMVGEMTDLRIVFVRAIRAALLADETPQGIEVGEGLRSLAPEARVALGRLRKDWATSSASLHQAVTRLGDPRRTALVGRIDGIYQTLFARADALIQVLDEAPNGTARPADVQHVLTKVAEFEVYIQEMAASLSSSVVEKP